MIRLFKNFHPTGYLYLLVYAFLLKGVLFFMPFSLQYSTNSILGKMFFDYLEQNSGSGWLIPLVSILVIYVQAVYFNMILHRFRMTESFTFLPAFTFLTVSSLIPALNVLNPAMISFFFFLPFASSLFRISEKRFESESLFFMAFFVSLASLFYFPSSFLILVIFFALFSLKKPDWRDLALIVTGFALPYYFLGIYFYLTGELVYYMALILSPLARVSLGLSLPGFNYLILTFLVLLWFWVGYRKLQNLPQQNVMVFRKYLNIFLFYCILGAIVIFIVRGEKLLFTYFFLMPGAWFISAYFQQDKPAWRIYGIYLVMLAIAAYHHWSYYRLMGF